MELFSGAARRHGLRLGLVLGPRDLPPGLPLRAARDPVRHAVGPVPAGDEDLHVDERLPSGELESRVVRSPRLEVPSMRLVAISLP